MLKSGMTLVGLAMLALPAVAFATGGNLDLSLQSQNSQKTLSKDPHVSFEREGTQPSSFDNKLPPQRVPEESKKNIDEAFVKDPAEVPPAEAVKRVEKSKNGQRTILDLQERKEISFMQWEDAHKRKGEATLVNLNPNVNSWYVLTLTPPGGVNRSYHIENPARMYQILQLRADYQNGLILRSEDGEVKCPLWGEDTKEPIGKADLEKPYTTICGQLYLRNKIDGYRTMKEWVVEFLRDNMWGGEAITSFFKKTVFKDLYLIKSENDGDKVAMKAQLKDDAFPDQANVSKEAEGQLLEAKYLAIDLKKPEQGGKLQVGKWYEAKGSPHIYISLIQPQAVSPTIYEKYKNRLKKLDATELSAQSYLVAFDLGSYEIGYALGTEHPRLDWSDRVRVKDRDARFPGPDGIGNAAPLVGTGLLNPADAKRVAATFTAGFKRSHGAFKWGKLATVSNGSHYGFAEKGVVFSRLQPGLATIYIDASGFVGMKTWAEEDSFHDMQINYARQNGVPLIAPEGDEAEPVPGPLVSNWMQGNWSGSEDMKFRTLRAGMCLTQNSQGRRFLVYGYFSSATPVAMAAVFKAYNCSYAQHLDMNALEHTYLALYVQRDDKNYYPQHLISGMKVLDERFEGNVPRFIGYPDNRDFFYVMRRLDEGEKDK